jgi:thiaminase
MLLLLCNYNRRACFQHYVLQDLFFLTRFARAYAAAIDKCGASANLGAAKAVLAELLLGVDAELKLHGSYAAKWGVAVDEWVWPSAATSAYTGYLMEVATDPEVCNSNTFGNIFWPL